MTKRKTFEKPKIQSQNGNQEESTKRKQTIKAQYKVSNKATTLTKKLNLEL